MQNLLEIKETRCINKKDACYPLRLREQKGMPRNLYVRGGLPCDSRTSVAVVGARSCSSYGKSIAVEYSRVLSDRGIQIISGLAMGIDGAAHQGALKGRTPTYAVLGSGVDICYPRIHQLLYQQIAESGGGILGEHPDGVHPRPQFFPARNRILSALSDVVLVVEARVRSGALITADFALEQGKSVFAVPGRVGDSVSEGCHRLIAQGAGIAYSPQVILEELGIEEGDQKVQVLQNFSRETRYLYSFLNQMPVSLEVLLERVPYTPQKIMGILLELEMEGLLEEVGKNQYIRRE